MTVLVDPPRWPAHGRLWSHLVSDTSLEELHAFARRVGIPARGFEGDHYDVPAERLDDLVAAGAVPVVARDLVRRLVASGLRVPKQRGQRVLASWSETGATGGRFHVDLLVSPVAPAAGTVRGVRVVARDGDRVALRRVEGSWALPVLAGPGPAREEDLVGFSRRRPAATAGATGATGATGAAGASAWRHLLLVRGGPGALDRTSGDELAWCDVGQAAGRCGHRPWWPLVGHALADAGPT